MCQHSVHCSGHIAACPCRHPKGYNPSTYTKLVMDRSYAMLTDLQGQVDTLLKDNASLREDIGKRAVMLSYKQQEINALTDLITRLKQERDELKQDAEDTSDHFNRIIVEKDATIARLHHSVSQFRAERRRFG
jgi:chromosome segregation ATPase